MIFLEDLLFSCEFVQNLIKHSLKMTGVDDITFLEIYNYIKIMHDH
jgi:hypothetical protein